MERRGVCDVVINVVHTASLHTQTHTNTLHLRDTQPVFRVTHAVLLQATDFSKNYYKPTKKKQVFYSVIFLNKITVFCTMVQALLYHLSKFIAH